MALQQLTSGLHYYPGATNSNKVAAFDLDSTLVRTVRGQFPKDSTDWRWLPQRLAILHSLQSQGYTLVIFTNQGYAGKRLTTALDRIDNIIDSLQINNINPWVFAATGPDSSYRKPSPAMWQTFLQYVPLVNMANSFYCGDAAGRPQDHSADDADFAVAIGLQFHLPERLFPNPQIVIPNTQTMFIFVGMPGAGKTTFYQQHLQPRGWIHANQDILKTQDRMINAVNTVLANGQSVAVDATNSSREKRRHFLNLAMRYRVPTLIIYFVGDGHGRNKLRTKPVPTVAYSMYYKNLEEPNQVDDGVPVIEYE